MGGNLTLTLNITFPAAFAGSRVHLATHDPNDFE